MLYAHRPTQHWAVLMFLRGAAAMHPRDFRSCLCLYTVEYVLPNGKKKRKILHRLGGFLWPWTCARGCLIDVTMKSMHITNT